MRINFLNRSNSNLLIIQLMGGLGNQLFQLANGIALAIKQEKEIVFEMTDLKRKFALGVLGLSQNIIYKVELADNQSTLYFHQINSFDSSCDKIVSTLYESTFTYQKLEIPSSNSRVVGYFQSHKYFAEVSTLVKNFLNNFLNQNFADVNVKDSETIVHVRLGDYFTDENTRNYHGLLEENYFLEAFKYFAGNRLVIVTESKSELAEAYPNLNNLASEVISDTPMRDFARLSRAKQLAISNSSFSWWSAYISKASVVAPKQWFSPKVLGKNSTKDLFPDEWTLI